MGIMTKPREIITAKIIAYLRFYWIILFLKKFQNIKFVRKLTKYFDPNWLRKISGFSYSPLIKIITWNKIKLYVDINDHIGFRSFIKNEPFEMSVFHVSALVSPEFKEDYIKLYIRNGNRGANSLLKKWNPSLLGDDYEWAPCLTLDSLLNNVINSKKIKLIKIDVEGMEYEVLKGGINFIKKSKIPILMEYRLDKNTKTKLKKILTMLRKIYNINGIDGMGKKIIFNPEESYENILFERKK